MAYGQSKSVANRWRTTWRGLVAVVGFLALATPAFAFTEPTEAPPGGNAIAAPLNVSSTEQTKLGRLNLGTGLVADSVALSVGSSALLKRLCLNDDGGGGKCIDDWSDIVGGGTVVLRSGATSLPSWATTGTGRNADPGYLAVVAQSNQGWAVGGQATDPNWSGATSAGVYGVSYTGLVTTTNLTYGVLGVGRIIADGTGIRRQSVGVTGIGESDGTAGYFQGKVGINTYVPNSQFVVNFPSALGNPGGVDDAVSIIANKPGTSGSALYAEQQVASAYAGYFSGRVRLTGSTGFPKLLVNANTSGSGNTSNAVDILANVTDTGLYVENPVPAAPVVGTDQWAGYFSGDTNFSGRVCLNDDGSRSSCISAWPSGGGGGQWSLNGAANTIFPNASSRRVAIGGTSDTAPFYYDPGANVLSLTGGNLALNSGALYLKPPPGAGESPPPDVGAASSGRMGERFADLLKPRAALAGSVTNPGGPPPVRLFVRDGVVSVEGGGNKLELGNAGRDIASDSDLYLRPRSVAGGSNAARLTLVNGNTQTQLQLPSLQLSGLGAGTPLSITHPGGTTSLSVSNTSAALASATILVTNNSASSSAHGLQAILAGTNNGSSSLYGFNASTSGWAGYFEGRVNVTSSLCFGGSGGIGGTDCRTSWPTLGSLGGVGGSGSVNILPKWTATGTSLTNSQVFDNGTVVRIGGSATSGARLIVNQGGTDGSGSSGDAIAAYTNSTNSAVYAQQANASGWAGYFSGGLAVTGYSATAPGLSLRIFNTLPRISNTSSAPLGHSFQLGGLSETSNESDGTQWRFYEAEGWDGIIAVGPSCVITPERNESSASGGQAVRITACNQDTIYTHTPRIIVPRGTYKIVVRIRGAGFSTPTDARLEIGIVRNAIFQNVTTVFPSELPGNSEWVTVGTTFSQEDTTTDFVIRFFTRGTMNSTAFWEIDNVLITPDDSPSHINQNVVITGNLKVTGQISDYTTTGTTHDVLSAVTVNIGAGETCGGVCSSKHGKSCLVSVDSTGGNYSCTSTSPAIDFCLCGAAYP